MTDAHAPPPLLIVGAGVLGRLAAVKWRNEHQSGECDIIGVTRRADSARDAELLQEGIIPKIRDDVDKMGAAGSHWPFVLFCASPAGNDDYAATVASAIKLWDARGGGRFVFTSSAGVYSEDSGGTVTETSPTADTPRAQKLLAAERVVVEAGGTVVRLVGLYLAGRGAHNYWLNQDEVAQRPDGLVNQLHYCDAAAAAVAALVRGSAGDILLAADDAPSTREQICEAAMRMLCFDGKTKPRFTSTSGGVGKVCDSSRTRTAIGWQPKFATFSAFVDSLASSD